MNGQGNGDSPQRGRLILAFLIVYIAWGGSYLAARVGVTNLPPFLFGGIRFVIAGAIMLGLAQLFGQRIRPDQREWRDLVVLALFGFLISNGLAVWAMQFVPSNQAALLNASIPCWIVLMGLFGRRAYRPSRRGVVGLLLGLAGTLLVLKPGGGAGGSLVPQLAILVNCLAWAASTVYLRNMSTTLPVLTLIGWQMLLGGLAIGAIGVARSEWTVWHWSWAGGLALVYLIVGASCLAHTAYAWLARHTSPTRLGTYAYVNPAIATLLGWLILDERLSALQLVGMVVVLTGVVMINWPRGRGEVIKG